MSQSANPMQEKVIHTLDKPVQVSAGAGAGKTWTLSKRLVQAFKHKTEEGEAFITEPSQLMGITFTNKAAAELAHRVRRMLKQEKLYEQARKIDEAWICTIDAMCKRILSSHALEINLNPLFELRDETESKELLSSLIQDRIQQMGKDAEESVLLKLYGRQKLEEILASLIEKLSLIERSQKPIAVYSTTDALQNLNLEQYKKEFRAYFSQIPDKVYALKEAYISSASDKEKKEQYAQYYDLIVQKVAQLENQLFFQQELSLSESCILVLEALLVSESRPRASKKVAEELNSFHLLVGDFIGLLMAFLSTKVLLIARELRAQYDKISLQEAKFDFTQIENFCLDILEQDQDLREAYQKQFKVLMVDEFQDTNPLQNKIISLLAGDKLQSLCTVGDEQQSIYAFRGADLAVYQRHKEEMQELEAELIEMDTNYRSHDYILRYVDAIFGQQELFGDKLLPLKAGRKEKETPYIPEDKSRITEIVSGKQAKTDEQAQTLASKLRMLRDEGYAPADMAILLETMKSKASVYKDYLQKEGFKVLIQGGSAYYETPELSLLTCLRKFLLYPENDSLLLQLLISELFAISEEDLLLMQASQRDKEKRYQESMWQNLKTYAQARLQTQEQIGLQAELQAEPQAELQKPADAQLPKLSGAYEILNTAIKAVAYRPLSEIIQYVIESCSYEQHLLQSGLDGLSRYLNILKYLEILKNLELSEGLAPYSFDQYLDELSALNDSPAALSASDAVKIMTIHASKGLEFPLVGVPEVPNDQPRSRGEFYLSRYDDNTYAFSLKIPSADTINKSFEFNLNGTAYSSYEKLFDEYAQSGRPAYKEPYLAFYALHLKEMEKLESLREQYRKYYVAFTRARERLIVVHNDMEEKKIQSATSPSMAAALIKNAQLDQEMQSKTADQNENKQENGGENQGAAAYKRSYSISRLSAEEVLMQYEQANEADKCDQNDQIDQNTQNSQVDQADQLEAHSVLIADEYRRLHIQLNPKFSKFRESSYFEQAPKDRQISEKLGLSLKRSQFATDFGTHFHRLAQQLVIKAYHEQARLRLDEHRQLMIDKAWIQDRAKVYLKAFDKLHSFSAQDKERLMQLLNNWFNSALWKDAFKRYRHAFVEKALMIPLDLQDGSKRLKGAIDLLFMGDTSKGDETNEANTALIVDFKTGYVWADDAHFEEIIELQAKKYAYSCLKAQLAQRVELAFYRADTDAVTKMSFNYEDLDELKARVEELYTQESLQLMSEDLDKQAEDEQRETELPKDADLP